METNNNDEWLAIPGFPDYRINKNDAAILSRRGPGKARILTKSSSNVLTPESGPKFGAAAQRFLYAATHGIDPRKMPRCLIVHTGEDGVPALLSASELMRIIAAKRKTRIERRNVPEEYEEIIRFSRLVMECYSSGDYGPVCTEIYKLKGMVTAYLRKRFNISAAETLEAAWAYVSDEALARISGRSVAVPKLEPYLLSIARSFMALLLREKKKYRYGSIDDPEDYRMNAYR